MKTSAPCLLMILDGWGINPSKQENAIARARTPFLDSLFDTCPHSALTCSGKAVGLPEGIMGNSEVGHLNIGAGRIVYQDLLRIDKAISDGSFFDNTALKNIMLKVKQNHAALHLMGLVSDGGVHSQLTHLLALIHMAGQIGLDRVYVHAILDGRDTPPESGVGYIRQLQEVISAGNTGTIATICGRYYAMDRDTRWDRTEKAYRLYTAGKGIRESDPVEAVKNAYGRGETDEFVSPTIVAGSENHPEGNVADRDGIIFFNFRADRARQITRAFTDPAFDEFSRDLRPDSLDYVCMTVYDANLPLPLAFPPVRLTQILGQTISDQGLAQLRIAETEKYAHVTYFFNGGEEAPFPMEDRCLVPSPREVDTYDQKPEMSAFEVAKKAVEKINSGKYDLIVLNLANMDMVGHTGKMDAAIMACEVVDSCVQQIAAAMQAKKGTILITADHGNAEKMADAQGNPHTAHTTGQVPLILVAGSREGALKSGILADIAPTILDIMGIPQPELMTGHSLFEPLK